MLAKSKKKARGSKKVRETEFKLSAPQAQSAFIAGDFNQMAALCETCENSIIRKWDCKTCDGEDFEIICLLDNAQLHGGRSSAPVWPRPITSCSKYKALQSKTTYRRRRRF